MFLEYTLFSIFCLKRSFKCVTFYITRTTSEHQFPSTTEDILLMTYLLLTVKLYCCKLYSIRVVFLCAGASEFTMKTLALYSAVAVVLVLADSTYGLKKEDCEGKNIKL